MATDAIFQGWDTNKQVVRYYCHFTVDATPAIDFQEGDACTAARGGVGSYTVTLNTPAGIGSAVDILYVNVCAQHAVIADAIKKWEVLGINQTTRVVTLGYTANAAAGPAVVADPDAGDGAFVEIVTRQSLAGQ